MDLQKKTGFGQSFIEDTSKSMAHETFKLEGERVLCLCNYIVVDHIAQSFGKTNDTEIKLLRTVPSQSTQSIRVASTWIFNWWNGWCAAMGGYCYMRWGFDPTLMSLWGLGAPLAYPTIWGLVSLRARRRVQKFQKLLLGKRDAAMSRSENVGIG